MKYNTVITTKEEEEEVNDTIYIYIVCRRGDASVCLTRHHRIIYINIMINVTYIYYLLVWYNLAILKKKLLLKMHK